MKSTIRYSQLGLLFAQATTISLFASCTPSYDPLAGMTEEQRTEIAHGVLALFVNQDLTALREDLYQLSEDESGADAPYVYVVYANQPVPLSGATLDMFSVSIVNLDDLPTVSSDLKFNQSEIQFSEFLEGATNEDTLLVSISAVPKLPDDSSWWDLRHQAMNADSDSDESIWSMLNSAVRTAGEWEKPSELETTARMLNASAALKSERGRVGDTRTITRIDSGELAEVLWRKCLGADLDNKEIGRPQQSRPMR